MRRRRCTSWPTSTACRRSAFGRSKRMRSRSCAGSWPSRWKRKEESIEKGPVRKNRPLFLQKDRSALLGDGDDRELDATIGGAALLGVVRRDRMTLARADRD